MNPKEAMELLKREEDESVKDLIQVANSLVDSFVSKSNAVALKMLFYVAKQQRKECGEITTFTLSADDFATYCKLDHRTIKENIKAMQKTSVSFVEYKKNGKPKIESHIVLIPEVTYNHDDKTIKITMFKKILDLIVQVEERFTTIDTKNVMELESKYSIRMTLILEQIFGYKGSPENRDVKQQKKFDLDELNGLFGTSYKTITDFKRKVLAPTKIEMDDKSDISFSYTINKGYNSPLERGRPKALGCTIKLTQNKVRQRRLF
jgi:plasmid replication initiation protein